MILPRILLIGSGPETLHALSTLLTGTPYQVEGVTVGLEALARMDHRLATDLVLLELGDANGDRLRFLKQLRHLRPDVAVVVLTAAGNTWDVIEAIRLGAQDYLNLPLREAELQQMLQRHLRPKVTAERTSTATIDQLGREQFFIATSPALRKIRILAELFANIDVPVLILGEIGTGKEAAAHLIHNLSSRSHRRFLKVNCAASPEELLESKLFGYERGAFAGAMRTKPGKFELADRGTILLDEVAEMPASLQAKLLHVLQDKQFFRLNGDTTIEVDVRILAATNVNIEETIAERRLREDFYYWLNAFTIVLPPLRERREEIPVLLHHFMQRMVTRYARPPVIFSPALIEACVNYSWPGNLRELENFVKRYVVLGVEEMAMSELQRSFPRKLISAYVARKATVANSQPDTSKGEEHARNLKFLVRNLKDETEVQAITKVLAETNWNRTRAARLLNISYRGLLYKIRRHGISRFSSSEVAPYLRNPGPT